MTGLVTVDGGVPAGSAGSASAGSAGCPWGTLSGSPRDDVSSFSLVLHADGLAGPIMVREYGCARPGPGNRAKKKNYPITTGCVPYMRGKVRARGRSRYKGTSAAS